MYGFGDVRREDLEDWGTPESVNWKTLDGEPKIGGRLWLGDGDGPVTVGVFMATRGSFEVAYPFMEHVSVIEGRVAATDESGTRREFGPGDSWLVKKGETVRWDVLTDYVMQSFACVPADL